MSWVVIRDSEFFLCTSPEDVGLLGAAARRHGTVWSSVMLSGVLASAPVSRGGYGVSELPKCDVADCPGHLGKFSSCVAEAVYEWSLDGTAESTGSTDFEGHYALFIVAEPEEATIDPDGRKRTVAVPAGNYILHSDSSGAVELWSYETERLARDVFESAETAYTTDAWDED
jgi:hypothetical protein